MKKVLYFLLTLCFFACNNYHYEEKVNKFIKTLDNAAIELEKQAEIELGYVDKKLKIGKNQKNFKNFEDTKKYYETSKKMLNQKKYMEFDDYKKHFDTTMLHGKKHYIHNLIELTKKYDLLEVSNTLDRKINNSFLKFSSKINEKKLLANLIRNTIFCGFHYSKMIQRRIEKDTLYWEPKIKVGESFPISIFPYNNGKMIDRLYGGEVYHIHSIKDKSAKISYINYVEIPLSKVGKQTYTMEFRSNYYNLNHLKDTIFYRTHTIEVLPRK